jgi:hypothetical protein
VSLCDSYYRCSIWDSITFSWSNTSSSLIYLQSPVTSPNNKKFAQCEYSICFLLQSTTALGHSLRNPQVSGIPTYSPVVISKSDCGRTCLSCRYSKSSCLDPYMFYSYFDVQQRTDSLELQLFVYMFLLQTMLPLVTVTQSVVQRPQSLLPVIVLEISFQLRMLGSTLRSD